VFEYTLVGSGVGGSCIAALLNAKSYKYHEQFDSKFFENPYLLGFIGRWYQRGDLNP
jgi:hypothetical protein